MSDPEISVVMAAANAADTVETCLDSLRRQALSSDTEVIVADCSTDGTDALIQSKFPTVKLLHFDRPVGLPQLLGEALARAQGRVVAVTDLHCTFAPDWLEKLRRAHDADFAVIGGAVENGRPDGLLSWACYFADYGASMLPSEKKVTWLLPGNHVSYKRSILDRAVPSLQDGFWKVFFHQDLAQEGVRFLFDPELVAYYVRRDTFRSFLQRYFRRAWYFAALRSKRISRGGRFFRLVGMPAVAFLLLYQRLRGTLGKRRHTAKLLLSIPLLAVFMAAWAAGEFAGYLLGPARTPREVYR